MAKGVNINLLRVQASSLGTTLNSNTTLNEIAILDSNGSTAEDKLVVFRQIITPVTYENERYVTIGPSVIPHTWTLEGAVETKTLPGMIPYITTHRRAKVLAIKGKLSAGTATVAIKRGSTTIATMDLTTAVSSGSLSNTDLANDEELYVQITAASGATNLSVTVHIRYY